MPATETIIDPTEAAKQISEKAQSELAALQAQLPGLQQTAVARQEEEDSILQQIEARKSHLATLSLSLQNAHTAHTDAVNYASVASGTIGEMDAIKSAVARKKELDDAQIQHDQTVQEHTTADVQDLARLETIRSEYQEAMTTLHTLHDRIRAVESVKQRSLSELGDNLHTTLMKEYQAYQAHTAETRAALIASQMDEQAFLEHAAAQLKAWPGLRTFKDALGTDTPLIRILQADLAYLDQLIADSQEARRQIDHPNILALPSNADWQWSQILHVPSNEIEYAGFGSVKTVETIRQRRARVASFLEQCQMVVR